MIDSTPMNRCDTSSVITIAHRPAFVDGQWRLRLKSPGRRGREGIDMSLRIRMLLASATVVLIVVPGVAVAGAGTGGRTNEDDQMVAAAKQTQRAIAAAYNDKKWDELR